MNREQLLACIWLRWRLSRNQFARAGRFNAALSVLLVALMVVAAVGSGVGGFLLGFLALGKAEPITLLYTWDLILIVFLFFWVSGLVIEIQRSESLDLTKLLHLPVSLRQVFLFNYLLSHFTPAVLLFLPLALGLSAGLFLRQGYWLALTAPLFVAFLFMLTAWTYCLRGWLTALMTNKRRRRAIVMWTSIIFVLAFQLPNLLFNNRTFQKSAKATSISAAARKTDQEDAMAKVHVLLPPGWVGYGTMALARSNPWPAVGAMAVCGLLGALGLARAYRMTLRFYTAAGAGAKPVMSPKVSAPAGPRRRLLVERSLPGLADDTAGLTLATFRSLLRAPELKMALIMPVIAAVALLSMRITRANRQPSEFLAAFALTTAAVVGTFAFVTVMSNLFGLDRGGFRAIVLLPIQRKFVLLAKNLAFFPFVVVVSCGLMLLVKFFIRLPWGGLVPSLLQMVIAFLMFVPFCNLLSILIPYRLSPGTLQAKKPKAIVFVAVLLSMLVTPILMAPAFIPPALNYAFAHFGWLPWLPVNLLASIVILALVIGLYWLLLPFQGRLLQAAEKRILREVTEETE